MRLNVEREELVSRLRQLQEAAGARGLDGVLLMQRADLIYYTGAVVQGALAVPTQGMSCLYVWRGHQRIGDDAPVEPTPIRGASKLPEALRSRFCDWQCVGLEEDVLPVALYKSVCLETWPHASFVDISPAVRQQRAVKSETELGWTREASRILVAGFEFIGAHIREGLSETELRTQMDVAMRREGDQVGVRVRSFNGEAPGLVAYGSSAGIDIVFDGPLGHSSRQPYGPMGSSDHLIGRHFPTIVDVVAGYNGYISDMTRCFALGQLEARFVDAHRFCVDILQEATRRLVPGAIPEEIYLWAMERAERAGFAENFMNRGNNKVRFLGHGVGLELDELPLIAKRQTDPLQENMVIALEPKIVFDDGAVGVEDTIIVKVGGGEVTTHMEHGIQFR